MPLLEIQGLTLSFGSNEATVQPVRDLSLSIDKGKTLGLVGESGSGKTLTAMSIARLLPPNCRVAGSVRLQSQDVLQMTQARLRQIRGRFVGYVFQDPASALNPTLKVGRQLGEVIQLHRPSENAREETLHLLHRVGLPNPSRIAKAFPHELSGGMRQRVLLAIAIAGRPILLVADEPTTALDVTIQAQILDLLAALQEELGMSLLLIAHNLGVVSGLADRLAVMYAGQIVEQGPARDVLSNPYHPYTAALLQSSPALGNEGRRLPSIPGQVPEPTHWPSGCRFHPRCFRVTEDCMESAPNLTGVSRSRQVRCPHWNEPEPKC